MKSLKLIVYLIVICGLVAVASAATVDERYDEARQLIQKGFRKEALATLRLLAENYPNHPLRGNFHFWAGHVLMKMERYEEACIEFSMATAARFSNKAADALFELGNCYNKIGKKDLAIREWQKFLELYPNNDLSHSVKKRLSE